MSTLSRLILSMGLALTAQGYANAQISENTQIDRRDVPPAVWKTARAIAPTAAFTEFGIEREGTQNIYELGAFDPDGLHLEIDVLADGTLQEIEWETPLNEVQMPVRNEFRFMYPDAEITYVERSFRPNGYTVYEIEGQNNDGTLVDLEVLDNGRRLLVLNTDTNIGS